MERRTILELPTIYVKQQRSIGQLVLEVGGKPVHSIPEFKCKISFGGNSDLWMLAGHVATGVQLIIAQTFLREKIGYC